MSDRVEERRQEQVYEQKKQQDTRTAKEKTAAAEKFKTAIASNLVAKQAKTGSDQKKQGEKNAEAGKQQGHAQNAFMARQGIVNRSQAEQLMKRRDESSRADESEQKSVRDKDLKNDREKEDVRSEDQSTSASTQRHDAAIQRRDDEQQQGQQQGQGQGQQQGQQQQGQGQQSGSQHKDGETTGANLGGVSAAKPKSAAAAAQAAQGSSETGKVVIGKTDKMAARERIPPQVLEKMVDQIHQHSQHGMNEFQIQLKDDALGGGSVRVTMANGKMKVVFTMKDPTAKNLLESSKGKLMRMFELKGLALESLEVKLRGQG